MHRALLTLLGTTLLAGACSNNVVDPQHTEQVSVIDPTNSEVAAVTNQQVYAPAATIAVTIRNLTEQTLYYSSGLCGVLERLAGADWVAVDPDPGPCLEDLNPLQADSAATLSGTGPVETGTYRYVLVNIHRSNALAVLEARAGRVPTNAFTVAAP